MPDTRALKTLLDQVPTIASRRGHTVWDARALATPLRNRWVELRVDDGQYPDMVCRGILVDVTHSPDQGWGLVLRGVGGAEQGDRKIKVRMPERLIRTWPRGLEFLGGDVSWPTPEVLAPCGFCHTNTPGRACLVCGRQVRSLGPAMGPGFSAWQALLEGMGHGSQVCTCGALALCGWHCAKCAKMVLA